ncbi:MAG: serine hydrolase domain-containing protein, partial [Anaerolineales bacterium]
MIPIDRKDLQAFIEYALKIFSHTRSMLLLTLCMLIFLSCTWSCSKNSRLSPGDGLDRFQQYLDNQIPEMLSKYDVPGVSLAIIRDGEIVLADAYGFADIESSRRMTVDAICRAESISKSVSAWGIMTLVQKGRVDLDEPIIRYLSSWSFPPSNYDEQQITIRQLLSNSAGLPLGTVGEETEYSPGSEMPSITQYLDQEARLAHRPGSRFEYSNPGY